MPNVFAAPAARPPAGSPSATSPRFGRAIASALAFASVLCGCAGGFATLPQPGDTRDSVLSRWGQPLRDLRLASGERFQYSQQPGGRFAWNIDFDASGRVAGASQVLTESNFNRIAAGRWTREDVEREFGPPAWMDRVASWPGPVMTYRWRDLGGADMFYWVYLDDAGVVRRAHPGMEFRRFPMDRS